MTINISGRSIEEGKLKNVLNYEWEDHKAPPFDTLFVICHQVARFLAQDDERIAVFHCNHGKGRTGTIICCFFLFMAVFSQTNEVMKFYAQRRFASEGYGVTQPCQIQYIRYFQTLLEQPHHYPRIMTLKSVRFEGSFSFQEPYIKMYRLSGKEIAYNSREMGDRFEPSEAGIHLKVKYEFTFVGDVTLEIKDNRAVGHNLLISYVFNTAFLPAATYRLPHAATCASSYGNSPPSASRSRATSRRTSRWCWNCARSAAAGRSATWWAVPGARAR